MDLYCLWFNIALLITGIFNLLILFYIYKFKLSDFTTIKIKNEKIVKF